MNSYLKSLRIKFEPDEVSYRKIESDMKKLSDIGLFSDKDAKIIENELKAFSDVENNIMHIEEALKAIANVDNDIANETRKKLEKELAAQKKILKDKQPQDIDKKQVASSIANELGQNLSNFGKELEQSNSAFAQITGKFISGLGGVAKNVAGILSGDLSSLKNILSSAVSSVGKLLADGFDELENLLDFSRISNKNTRELMFGYGFSNQEAYSYSKAMDVMGFESEEDLMYAAQNPEEIAMFREAFNKYSDKYNQLYDSGTFEQMRQFDVEMAEFKEDVKLEVVQFFMNNKDTIKSAMKWLISLAEFTIGALGKIVKWLNPDAKTSDSQKAANTASIISNYSSVNSRTNVSIDNTFNNVNHEDQRALANAGQMTYEQVIRALS